MVAPVKKLLASLSPARLAERLSRWRRAEAREGPSWPTIDYVAPHEEPDRLRRGDFTGKPPINVGPSPLKPGTVRQYDAPSELRDLQGDFARAAKVFFRRHQAIDLSRLCLSKDPITAAAADVFCLELLDPTFSGISREHRPAGEEAVNGLVMLDKYQPGRLQRATEAREEINWRIKSNRELKVFLGGVSPHPLDPNTRR